MKGLDIKPIDLVPALSGLLGKIALISSFALVWKDSLGITGEFFVLNNVRLELLIACIIAFIAALINPKLSPPGTLAPLVVLIPFMADFGVHPLILSVLIGIIGIVFIKTSLLQKLVNMLQAPSKSGISLVIGVSGIIMSLSNIRLHFISNLWAFIILIGLLVTFFLLFSYIKKVWLMVPVAMVTSLIVVAVFNPSAFNISANIPTINLSPVYWWQEMWGIGFGFDIITILKTLPFAILAIILWAVDTASIKSVYESYPSNQAFIDINKSFLVVSFRNMIGGIMGGAHTSSLWRSYLIPQFMVNRPQKASILIMSIMGIIVGALALPLQVLTLPPVIWSVLLFGIFFPFVRAGFIGLKAIDKKYKIIIVIAAALVGIIINPIIAFLILVGYEIIYTLIKNRKEKEKHND